MPPVCAALLAAPSVTLPADSLGIRGFRTPGLSESLRLGQTFTMTADGLSAIEVFPVADGKVSGDIRFALYELSVRPGDSVAIPVRSREVQADELFRTPSYSFEFAPILDSKDRAYRLDLVASPAEGVAFWATTGERYGGGAMHANGRPRWADLAFRTHAPVPSVWAHVRALRRANPVRANIMIGAAAATWVLLGVVVRRLVRHVDESVAGMW